MSYSKKQIIIDAFEEIGITDLSFELDAGEMVSALRKLDRMIASWEMDAIYLGYPLAQSPNESDINQNSNVPDYALNAVVLNLACNLAYSKGRELSRDYISKSRDAYKDLISYNKTPPVMNLDSRTPLGQGNREYGNCYNKFVRNNSETINTANTIIDLS